MICRVDLRSGRQPEIDSSRFSYERRGGFALKRASSTSTPLLQVVNRGATATTLMSTPNPSSYGQTVTFTATVSGGGPVGPTGSVTFFNGPTNLGSSNLHSDGVATLSIAALPVGRDFIAATYNGDSNYNPSTSAPLLQVVNRAATSTTLNSAPNPSTYGQLVTFTATVSGSGPTGPTGSVTFFTGSTNGSGNLNSNGIATLSTAADRQPGQLVALGLPADLRGRRSANQSQRVEVAGTATLRGGRYRRSGDRHAYAGNGAGRSQTLPVVREGYECMAR